MTAKVFTVGELLKDYPQNLSQRLEPSVLGLSVQSVTADSREVAAGCIFVAVRGVSQDGHQFIAAARKAGAVLVVGESPSDGQGAYLQVDDSRLALARLAAGFYGHPSHSMLMVGVTGTSGKTTTTYILESILREAGHEVGVIGTVNFRHGDKILPSTHTTPGAVELQRLLAQMKAEGCTAVVMEVSSHALKQRRAAAIAFDAVVFTNLSPEHLDFHPDMEDYFNAKKLLFTDSVVDSVLAGKKVTAAVNADDPYGKRLLREISARSFGMESCADVSGEQLRVGLDGIHGLGIHSHLTGRFNASNLLAAMTVAQNLDLSAQVIARGIARLRVVPGRLERVPHAGGIHVLVDYAHKPDALEKVLKTLGEVKGSHRLITVFGCGGDRDRTKRPVMGRLAVELSDQVFLTSDNPRTEDPAAIIQEIQAGMSKASNVVVDPDRKNAIFAAIRFARPGDLVLIAGKGHEDYQIVADSVAGGTKKIHFDDREVALEALKTLDTSF